MYVVVHVHTCLYVYICIYIICVRVCGSDLPLVTWQESTEGRPVQSVHWCRSRPSVFFVLDSDATLYIWDLSMDDAVPLKQERIAQTRSHTHTFETCPALTLTGLRSLDQWAFRTLLVRLLWV